MKFVETLYGEIVVYSGGLKIGYLNKGNRYGFFTDRKSFSVSEMEAIALKLKELNT